MSNNKICSKCYIIVVYCKNVCKPCYKKQYRIDNYKKNFIVKKEWCKNNKEKLTKINKEWCKNNVERVKKNARIYCKNKRQNDIKFKIKGLLYSRLHHLMKLYTENGKISSSNHMGIDWSKVVIKLAKELPYDYKDQKYHIDHIKPLKSFNLEDPAQIILAFAPENHQWLSEKDNLNKSNKWPFIKICDKYHQISEEFYNKIGKIYI